MDSIIEVAARERADACEVLLYPEGIFYKAYGYSAFRFVRWIRPYQVKKRAYKKLGAQMCYMGFPQTALDGLLGADFRADRMDDGTVVIRDVRPRRAGSLRCLGEQHSVECAQTPCPGRFRALSPGRFRALPSGWFRARCPGFALPVVGRARGGRPAVRR